MKTVELLERLKLLAEAGKATDTAFLAPLNASHAAAVLHHINASNYNLTHAGIQVTCQDLRDFIHDLDEITGI
jgi:hypothetical protein